jgi:transposase
MPRPPFPFAWGQTKIYLYAKDVDMRKSFDGLHAIIQSEFRRDVRQGDLFLFLNRRLDRIKLMHWDTDGLVIWMKKLESQYPRCFTFTGIGRVANNRTRRPTAVG